MKKPLFGSIVLLAALQVGATDYYWIGGSEGSWANGNNWALTEGGETAGAYPSSNTDDKAIIGSAVTINLSTDVNCAVVELKAAVTLVGGKLAFNSIASGDSESHTLTISGTELRGVGAASISAEVETAIAAETSNTMTCEQTKSFDVFGSLSGTGSVLCTISGSKNGGGVKFQGDTTKFAGILTTAANGNQRASHQISVEAATKNASSSWRFDHGETFGGGGSSYTQYFPLRVANTTYVFGALNGTIPYCKGTNGWLPGVKFEVGARNEDCVLKGDFGPVTGVEFTWLAEGATIDYQVKNTAQFKLTGSGTVLLTSTLPESIEFAGEGGVLKTALDPSANIVSSAAPIIFDDEGENAIWASAVAASNVGGFTKRGVGTLTLAAVPLYTGATVVEAGTLLFAAGSTIDELMVADGAKVGVHVTTAYVEPTEVLTIKKLNLADGQKLEDVIPNTATVGYEFVTDEATGSITVKATRPAATYVWTGATDSNWQNPANWSVNGESIEILPISIDSIVVPAKEEGMWLIEMSSGATVAEVKIEGDTELAISGDSAIRTPIVWGAGTITVTGSGFFAPLNSAYTYCDVSNNLVFAANDKVTVKLNGAQQQRMRIHGDVAGKGDIVFDEGAQRDSGVYVYGDWQSFSGSFTTQCSNQYHRDFTQFNGPKALSPNAAYTIWGNTDNKSDIFASASGESREYKAGSISGHIQMMTGGYTLEVGSLNTDFSCSGMVGHQNSKGEWGYRMTLRKIGSGTFTNDLENLYCCIVKEGAVKIEKPERLPIDTLAFEGGEVKLAADIDPSAIIKNSLAAIAVDDEGTSSMWATALSASNVGGFTKRGAGTLTLAAAPQYAGYTRVEAGELVMPEGTSILWDVSSPAETNAVTGAAFAGFGVGPAGATWVYGVDEWSDANNYVDLTNLKTIDLTSVKTISKGQKFVIMTAKGFQIDGKPLNRTQRETIEIKLDESVAKYAAEKGYSLRVIGNDLVYAPREGMAIILR